MRRVVAGLVLMTLAVSGLVVYATPEVQPYGMVAVPTQHTSLEPEAAVERKPVKKPKPKPKPTPHVTPHNSVWDKIAECESGGNWSNNDTGNNGHYGGLQFSLATWKSVGGPGMPHHHSREVQIKYAKILQQRAGWGQWSCAHARFN